MLLWVKTTQEGPPSSEGLQRMLKLLAALMPDKFYEAFHDDLYMLSAAGFKENMKEEKNDDIAAS